MTVDRSRDSLVRLPEVRSRTGMSTATIYRKMDLGQFPAKIVLSANIVAWYESDINAWVADPMGWQTAA
jgi:prophage regulatory protein